METSRDRFHKIMDHKKPDRIPYFEEGIRKDVIKTWQKQGLKKKKVLSDLFPTDHFEEIVPDLEPKPKKKWPTSPAELDDFRKSLDPDDKRRFPLKWQKNLHYLQKQHDVLMLRVHRGFFLSMGVYDWNRFTDIIYLLHDDPGFVSECLKIQGAFAASMAKKIIRNIKIDAAIFTEPIGGNEGPLISPGMYKKLVLPAFLPIFDVLQQYEIKTIIFKTYANVKVLIPVILEFGFTCLWACETNNQAMDYRDLRSQYGTDLRLIGGIDLDALRKGKEAIRKEVVEKVPFLLDQGGYIPLADGRVRKDVSFENYVYYRSLLAEVTQK